jgi:hypothetical protein
MMWVTLLRMKDEAAEAIRRFTAGTEMESGQRLRTLRTDRGGEFTSAEFAAYCAKRGTGRHLTAPYSPQQNGVVERRNQTIIGMARSMLKGMGVPASFWGEAVSTAVHILNRSFTRSVDGQTPFEAWHGHKPDVQYLRVFGCRAHVKITRPGLKKLDDRSVPAVFLGYEPGSKAYMLYDPVAKRILVSRDVVFDEGHAWDWQSASEPVITSEFVMESTDYGGDVSAPVSATAADDIEPQEQSSPDAAEPSTPWVDTDDLEFATPPTAPDPELFDAEDDTEAPHRYRRVADLHGDRLFLTSAEEPACVADAERDPCWSKAMEEEMKSIEENHTWELVDLPRGHRAIGLKWVFKAKRDAGSSSSTRHALWRKDMCSNKEWITKNFSLQWLALNQCGSCWL